MPAGFAGIEPLEPSHEVADFDCLSEALNHWLKTWARHSQRVGSARTFVACPEGSRRVVGYHALAAASAAPEVPPKKMIRNLGNYPVPLVLLARLAVDREFEKRGLGRALMRDSFIRTVQAADQIGAVALMVNAKDEEARSFYEHFGFESSPLQPLQLFLPLRTIRQAMIEASQGTAEGEPAG